MTRPTVKAGLVALSLAATLGAWAILAIDDSRAGTQAPEAVIQTIDLQPIPTLALPPAAGGLGADNTPGIATLDLPPIPALNALSLRPLARTRSSR